MIRTGSFLLARPDDTPPPTGLAGDRLSRALERDLARVSFLLEHLDHPTVAQGVVEAITDARDALAAAADLHERVTFAGAIRLEAGQ